MRLVSLNVGRAAPLPGHPKETSAICKKAVAGPVHLGTLGLAGDEVVDHEHHGGPLKAACAYGAENYQHWATTLGEKRPFGEFGENFTIAGGTDDKVCMGDIYDVGAARVQVANPRKPCYKLSAQWHMKDFAARVEKERRTGFYLRVLRPGAIESGMDFKLVESLCEGWTIARFWDLLDGTISATPAEMEQFLSAEWIATYYKSRLKKRLDGEA